jgi:hypothetical protein
MLVISAYIPSGMTLRIHLHSGVNLRILGDQRGIRGLAINKPDEALHPKSLSVAAVYEELCLRFTRQHVVHLKNFSFLLPDRDPTYVAASFSIRQNLLFGGRPRRLRPPQASSSCQ